MGRTASNAPRRFIIDSSAILAVMLREPGWEPILECMESAEYVAAAAPTLVEAGMVFLSRGGKSEDLDRFLRDAGIEALPFGGDHFRVALEAFRRYGKGRNPAALNFGDCMSYAAAVVSKLPLLFVGEDFTRTDVPAALPRKR